MGVDERLYRPRHPLLRLCPATNRAAMRTTQQASLTAHPGRSVSWSEGPEYALERQPLDVDQPRGAFDVLLHQVDQIGVGRILLRRQLQPRSPSCSVSSAAKLTHVISQPLFDIARPMEAALHQRLYPGLAGGSSERSEKRIPLRRNFRVRRQTGNINQALCFRDGLFVE